MNLEEEFVKVSKELEELRNELAVMYGYHLELEKHVHDFVNGEINEEEFRSGIPAQTSFPRIHYGYRQRVMSFLHKLARKVHHLESKKIILEFIQIDNF